MKTLLRLMLCMVLATSLYSLAGAEPYATGTLKECVYTLPNDSGKLYVSVTGSSSDADYKHYCSLFNETSECKAIKDEAQYKQLTTQSKLYAARYGKDFKEFPTIRIQHADGSMVQEWSGNGIPSDADLVASVKAECFRRHRQDQKQKQNCVPDKKDTVDRDADKNADREKNDRREVVPQGKYELPPWKWSLGALVLGALVGLGDWYRQALKDK